MDSHKILLKRCGHVYCIKCSEAVLESSEKETRCKVCDTIIPTECFKYMTYILKGKDNVVSYIALAFSTRSLAHLPCRK